MLSFKEYLFLTEAFGGFFFDNFRRKFSEFKPTFKRDGKTISFEVGEMDKDGLLIHLQKFLEDAGTKLKHDFGDLATYKLNDNIVSIKPPQKEGKRYIINLKFAIPNINEPMKYRLI